MTSKNLHHTTRIALNHRSLSDAAAYLAGCDEDLKRIFDAHGVPPLWNRKPGFQTLIQIILEQQVSLASAAAVFRRLQKEVVPLTPGRFSDLGMASLRSLGLTRQKASYCIHVADAACRRQIDFDALSELDDASVEAALIRVKGVGPWTANIYLLRAMCRPDIWPAGDIALVSSLRSIKTRGRPLSPDDISSIAGTWRPYRSVAARMLWQHYLSARSKKQEK
ncbi:MAG: DNA-3-methyladenine glycosylase family protein [Nitrospiria bacterium]